MGLIKWNSNSQGFNFERLHWHPVRHVSRELDSRVICRPCQFFLYSRLLRRPNASLKVQAVRESTKGVTVLVGRQPFARSIHICFADGLEERVSQGLPVIRRPSFVARLGIVGWQEPSRDEDAFPERRDGRAFKVDECTDLAGSLVDLEFWS